MSEVAIIGGTGLYSLSGMDFVRKEVVHTPYGSPSGPLLHGRMCGREVAFLARHGYGHTIAPHVVNYRANLWALHKVGVRRVLAVASVGGIAPELEPGTIVLPGQLIDYTWGRAHTFSDDERDAVSHIEFTRPYDEALRGALAAAAGHAGIGVVEGGTYAAVQGPRLETAAEIDRLERDGAHVVGMTGMPEAALARELELAYACIAVVANRAAGRGDEPIGEQIKGHLEHALQDVHRLLEAYLSSC